jgi:hypothetical protein
MTKPPADIRYLRREDLDPVKWNACVKGAENSLIYARTFYLDAMAPNWNALVLGEYEAVMPLTWRRKFGFSYLYQPAFTAQLGIFCTGDPDGEIEELFIARAKKHFLFCEIHLNYNNKFSVARSMANYVINLEKSYGEIRRGYKKRLLENLREAETFSLNYLEGTDLSEVILLYKTQYGYRLPQVRQSDYDHFDLLCRELQNRNMIFIRQVRDKSGELLNNSIFLQDDRRIYNIMSVSLAEGRVKRAHFFLLDQLIAEFAGKKILLDLEGSDIPGIAEFYQKFGSFNQPYPFLKYNNLPFPFRLFK